MHVFVKRVSTGLIDSLLGLASGNVSARGWMIAVSWLVDEVGVAGRGWGRAEAQYKQSGRDGNWQTT